MDNWLGVTLTCAALSVPVNLHAPQTQPVPDNPLRAQTSLGFNLKTRCPDLRMADEGTIAVVIFWLPISGPPSQVSIKSPSGSNALDFAAISCVSRLRFAPATTLGNGDPIDSWQQIALTWASNGSEPIARTPANTKANAKQDESRGQANNVTVHVCVD